MNVESEPELERLSAIAAAKGRSVDISVRVNPDVDARTHAKIATGKSENKFGIPISRARAVYAQAAKLPGIRVAGVDMHIGSQITDLTPFADAFALLSEFVQTLRADGHTISHVDLGGGLGIPYRDDADVPPDPEGLCGDREKCDARSRLQADFRAGAADRRQCRHSRHARDLCEARRGEDLRHRGCGDERSHPADALRSASRILAGAGSRRTAARRSRADIVGPICETGDYLALDRKMAEPKVGDLLAIMSAGAYGAVQAGTYNTRALIPESHGQGRSMVCDPAPPR